MSLEIWKDAVNYSYIQVPDGCLKNLSDWCKCLLKVQLHLKTAIFLVVPQNADNNPFKNKVLDIVLFYVLRHFRLNLVGENWASPFTRDRNSLENEKQTQYHFVMSLLTEAECWYKHLKMHSGDISNQCYKNTLRRHLKSAQWRKHNRGDTLKRTEEKKANEKGTHYHSGIALLADWGAVLVETLENAQWRNIKQMQPLKTPWGEILSCIVEKALWGDIWKVK